MGELLDFKAKVDFRQAKRDLAEFEKMLKSVGVSPAGASKSFDTKPLTEYQKGMLDIKRAASEAANSQKNASLLMQKALNDARLEVTQLIKTQKELEAELARSKGVAQGYRNEVEQLKISEQTLKNEFQQGKVTLQQYTQQIEQNKIAQQGLNAALTQAAIDDKRAATALKEHNLQQKQIAEAARQARTAFKAASGSYDEANARLKELGRSIKAAEGGFKSTSPAIKAQINEYNTLNEALKRFDEKLGNHQRKVGDYRGALSGAIADLRSLAISYISVQGALTAAMKSFDVNRQSQAIEASLKFTLGSTEAATDKINELRTNALRLGQDFLPVAESYAKFAGAARAANFPLSETDRIFKAVSVAGARFNLTTDQMSGALLALQQMISKGTVQSEELRGQLGERLPGAFTIAAKAMGVNEKQLGKLLETGQVLASDLLPKLATQLEKDFGLKAGESIDNLNSSVGRLSTTTDTALKSDGFGKLAKYIVDGTTGIISAFDKLMGSRSVSEFFARFFSFKKSDGTIIGADAGGKGPGNSLYDNINAIHDAYEKSKKVLFSEDLNPTGASAENVIAALSERTLGELKEMHDKYLSAGNQAAEAVRKYRKGIAEGFLKDSGKYKLKDVEDNFKSLQKTLIIVNSAYRDALKKAPKVVDTDRTIEDIKADIKRVTELKAPLDTASKQYKDYVKQLQAFKKELKLANGGVDSDLVKADSVAKSLIGKRNTLQGEIDKMIAASSRKQMSSDVEEIQSVTDKYKVLRDKAKEYYDELNKNIPKNKQKGFGLTLSGLFAAEEGEKAGVRDKQATEKLKVTLDKQKQLYDDFENYKKEVGEESAKKLYAGLIDTDKTYLEHLKAQRERLTSPDAKAKGGLEVDGQTIEKQLAEINKRIDEAELDNIKTQTDHYKKLLAENQSYLQQRKNLQDQYNIDSATLRAKGDKEEADELARRYQLQLTELDKSHVEQLKAYTDLFDNMDNMSTAALRRSIANLKKEVGKLQLTPEAKEFFDKMFNGLDQRAHSQSANDYKNIASALGDAAQYAGSLDESLGKALSTAANLAGQVGNIKQGLSDFKAAQKSGDGFGQASSIIGIFGAVMGIFSGLASLFDGSKRAAEQMQHSQELQLKATEAVTKALERQFGLIKEVYGTERLIAYRKQLDDIDAAQKKANASLQNKLSFTGNKIIDDYIEKFNKGIKNDFFNIDSVIDQIKNQYALAGKTIKELQELLEKGLLDSSTGAIVQSLIDLEQQAKAVRNALTEEITGVNFDSLTDKIKGVFDSGETSAKNFADAIETSIQGAFSNAFKRKEIEQRMQPLFDALYKAGEDGTFTNDEINKLREMRDKISQELADRAKVYEQIIGNDPSSADNISALQKGIKSITADQASALEGILRGSFDQQKKMVNLMDASSNIWRQQLDAAMSGIKHLEAIERNTANTVTRLDAAVTELKAINKNTGGQSGRDMGM